MWVAAGLAAINAVSAFVTRTRAARVIGNGSSSDVRAWDDSARALEQLQGVASLLSIAVLVLVIVWSYQAHSVTQQLWRGERKWGHGWTVAAWFIPIANLVMPKLVISEIERIAGAPRTPTGVDSAWRARTPIAIGRIGWVLIVAGNLVVAAGTSVVNNVDFTLEQADFGAGMQGVGHVIQALAYGCGARYFRQLGRWLTPAHAQLSQVV